MSVFGALRSGVSGLFAQSQSMAMISDNIANSNTYGYKRVEASFGHLVTVPSAATSYSTGGVMTTTLRHVDQQGLLESSVNSTDMAVLGDGFFAVTDNLVLNDVTEEWEVSGEVFYTRAGQFYPDENGNLVTPQGFYLLGWERNEMNSGYIQTNVVGDFDVVNAEAQTIAPIATTEIELQANLQSSAPTDTTFQIASQIVDKLGTVKTLTMTFTKNGDTTTDTTSMVWDITGTLSDNAYFTEIGEDGDSGTNSDILASDGSGNPLEDVNLGKISFHSDGTLKRYIPPVYHNDVVTVIGTVVDTNADGVADGIDINSFDGSDLEDTDNDGETANIIAIVDINDDGIADREVDLTIPNEDAPPYVVNDNRISVYYMNDDRTAYVDADGNNSNIPVVKYNGTIVESGADQDGDVEVKISNGTLEYYVDHNDRIYQNWTNIENANGDIYVVDLPGQNIYQEWDVISDGNSTLYADADGNVFLTTTSTTSVGTYDSVTDAVTYTDGRELVNNGTDAYFIVPLPTAGTYDVYDLSDVELTTVIGTYDSATEQIDFTSSGGVVETGFPASTITATQENMDVTDNEFVAVGTYDTATNEAEFTDVGDHNAGDTDTFAETNTTSKVELGDLDAEGTVSYDDTTLLDVDNFVGVDVEGSMDASLNGTLEFYGRAIDTSVTDASDDNDLDDDNGTQDGIVDEIDLLLPGEYIEDPDTGEITFHTVDEGLDPNDEDDDVWTELTDTDGIQNFAIEDVSLVNEGSLYANKYANDEHDPIHEVMQLTIDYDGDWVTNEDHDRVDVLVDFGPLGGISGMKSFDEVSSVTGVNQNGEQAGSLASLSVNGDGELTGTFDNGSERQLYQIPLVTFANPLALDARSNNVFAITEASGEAIPHVPNTGGSGEVVPASLESSAVDIAQEFTKMIVTQRAYSANTKVITTSDEMLDELIRAKR